MFFTPSVYLPFSRTGGGGTGATLLFEDHFTALDLATDAHTNGVWMVNDAWQNRDRGYEDFAGKSFNLSPMSATTLNVNPFSVANSILTIQSFRTPANLVAPIRTEMDAQ